ncbi:phage tail sheath family protein [Dyella humicola]|uniref:phage tail sheath family protein n=1 Tax=Dyella humicola TaxID=2992126 RepID=UPI002254D424|nr:phage tail sheath C-terminal domain-containing protein [Dyella humicola]
MAVQVAYPGVYVQEVPSGVRTIVGVSTSIACFVGRTKSGPLSTPTRIQSLTDFIRTFGDDAGVGDMSRYVRLFFLNGGTVCYVTRISSGAAASSVTLLNEAGKPALILTALSAGTLGDTIRAAVDYNTPTPESTFNLTLFQSTLDSRGQPVQTNREVWNNLSMDPNSSSYAPTVLTQKSVLVNATDPKVAALVNGSSLSTAPIEYDPAAANAIDYRTKIAAALKVGNSIQICVDGSPPALVTFGDFSSTAQFPGTAVGALRSQFNAAIVTLINNALGGPTVQPNVLQPGPDATPSASEVLFIESTKTGDVLIQSASVNDAAAALGLGASNGGVEISAYSARRPAPTGVVYKAYDQATLGSASAFLNLPQTGATAVNSVTLDAFDGSGNLVSQAVPLALADSPAANNNWQGSLLTTKLARWADAVNAYQAANPSTFRWTAQVWGMRIAFLPTAGDDNAIPPFATGATDVTKTPTAITNVRYYRLGLSGGGTFQNAGVAGVDGNPPAATDYDTAYGVIDHAVDLFNLMILPPTGGTAVEALYANASVFCQQRRAFLLMDPPSAWTSPQAATSNVGMFRIGLVKDYSAVYFPHLTINEGGLNVTVGAAGAVAGIYARTDANRGVWKAPAGTEADFRGVTGVDLNLTDGDSGQLNPLAINGIRAMPEGVLSWGARTNDGADMFASEYKYVPVRRFALYIEESLYRGLKWVVFEPNDDKLWASIRLNVGTFMNGLFRQGAFFGTTPQDAYFVKCDAETTPPSDQDLGIVNIWVGFAPLKPAEFVVLYIQQIAGLPTA